MSSMPHIDSAWGRDPAAPFHAELYEAFTVKTGYRERTWIVEGPCPYCAGSVRYEIEREGVPSDTTEVVAQSESPDVLMIECTCTAAHAGRPAGVRGCGQMWTLELEAS